MSDTSDKFLKVVVGLALEECIRRGQIDSRLGDLFVKPHLEGIKLLYEELTDSHDHSRRAVGFYLEPAIERSCSKEDWRDLVIEMQETELNLFNLFWLLTSAEEPKYIVESNTLRDWLNEIGTSAGYIRNGDWCQAKIHLSVAVEKSRQREIEVLSQDRYLQGAIEIHQRDTERYFAESRKFSAKLNIPKERCDLVEEVQDIFIELLRKLELGELDSQEADLVIYPTEKMGVAFEYLIDASKSVEQANYEIGLAAQHFAYKIPYLRGTKILFWADKMYGRIDKLFSILPAKPWPVEGFGEPGVESRFSAD